MLLNSHTFEGLWQVLGILPCKDFSTLFSRLDLYQGQTFENERRDNFSFARQRVLDVDGVDWWQNNVNKLDTTVLYTQKQLKW